MNSITLNDVGIFQLFMIIYTKDILLMILNVCTADEYISWGALGFLSSFTNFIEKSLPTNLPEITCLIQCQSSLFNKFKREREPSSQELM